MVVTGTLWIPSGVLPALMGPSQPGKGIVATLLCVAIGGVIATLSFRVVGHSIGPPTPPLTMYMIFTVILAFWAVLVWNYWPFSSVLRSPVMAGIAMLIFCYLGGSFIFRGLFNFEFLRGAPVYAPVLDPGGLVDAWTVTSFGVLSVALVLTTLLLDCWPMARWASAQPLLGVYTTAIVLALSWVVYVVVTGWFGVDKVKFMAHGSIPYIFGTFFPLKLFVGRIGAGLRQPAKGLLCVLVSFVIGNALQFLYLFASERLMGSMGSGAPGYELQVWLASALLAVTFPMIVLLVDFFEFWPLRPPDPVRQSTNRPD